MTSTPIKTCLHKNQTALGLLSTSKKHQSPHKGSKFSAFLSQVAEEPTPEKMEVEGVWRDRPLRVEETRQYRRNRIRMTDWLCEVFTVFELGWEAYWMCLELFDSLMGDHHLVSMDNFHLTGVTCLFIASKFINHKPVTTREVVRNISNRAFEESDIIEREQVILDVIFERGPLERATPFCWLIEDYGWLDEDRLKEALKWMVIAWCRPEICVELGARTYRSLVELCVSERGKEQLRWVSDQDRERLNVEYVHRNYRKMTLLK